MHGFWSNLRPKRRCRETVGIELCLAAKPEEPGQATALRESSDVSELSLLATVNPCVTNGSKLEAQEPILSESQ